MGVFERIKSAASGAIPVEDDLDMGDNQRVTNLPASQNSGDAARAGEVPAPAPQFYRQDTLPSDVLDGATLVTDADGSGDDTTSRYVFNASAGEWELDSAVGPSEPSLGTPVAGALWRDTSDGSGKQYDGSGFVTLSPTSTEENTLDVIADVNETVPAETTETITIDNIPADRFTNSGFFILTIQINLSDGSSVTVDGDENGYLSYERVESVDLINDDAFDRNANFTLYKAGPVHTHPL